MTDRTSSKRRALRLVAPALLAAALVAGCGGDDGDSNGDGSAARPAPAASEFPSPDGQTLRALLTANASNLSEPEAAGDSVVVSPAARVLEVGENRFPFGVFTVEREPIDDAEVAIYAAPKDLQGPAQGPYPARIEDLSTESAFVARTTADDPDSAKVAYVSEVPLDQPGEWVFAALIKEGDSYISSLLPTPSLAGEFDPVAVGEMAPKVSTPTADDVTDIADIDTRVPPSSMHDEDFADVVGKKPVVLLFATPALCQSRICGPVVDVAEQVKRDFGDRVAFIHQEIWQENDINKGPRPQVDAFRLPSEPWLYVIDEKGEVSGAIEGAFSVEELTAEVEKVAQPGA